MARKRKNIRKRRNKTAFLQPNSKKYKVEWWLSGVWGKWGDVGQKMN